MSELAELPRTIGKYRLDSVLGRGAMGVVYRAYDPLIERTLALKTVLRQHGDPEQTRELLQRFRKEAQAAGRLMHPNIVAVYEYGESEELAFIAMEFVDGRPLSALAAAGPASLPQVLAWMGDLLAALAYSHAHGVVHRDIKPANLLVTREGRIKVGDFGIARIESSTLTQTGAMLGTPSYMAPEQFRGERIDGRSDLFSAGVLLYQLLTGERPFTGTTATVMQQILSHTPPPPSSLNPALPPALDAVVLRALAKRQDERFPDAAAFRAALEAASLGQAHTGGAYAPNQGMIDEDATLLLPAGAASWPAHPSDTSVHGATSDLTAWKRAALPELEALLTAQIGPVARLLLRRIAAAAPDFAALREQLLAHIPSPAARAGFEAELAALEERLFPPSDMRSTIGRGAPLQLQDAPPAQVGAAQDSAPPTPRFVAAASALLAAEIGPIAAIVVKRALAQAGSGGPLALLEAAARQIDAADARERFLARGRQLPFAD